MIGPGTAPSAMRGAVERAHAADAEAGGGEEHLVRGYRVVDVEVALLARDAERDGQVQDHPAAHPGQHVLLAWSEHAPAAHHEDVAPHALAQVAVIVEHDRPGIGAVRLHFLLGQDQIQVVVRLGPWAHLGRGHPARGGDDHVDAVAKLARARFEG